MGQVISRKQSLESKHCTTLGLYESSAWDNKTLKKMIIDKKLAPIFPGLDCKDDLEECPICMLYYPYLNTSTCCKKNICTECFLQVRKPGPGSETDCCPFCTSTNYNVTFNGRRSEAQLKKEREEDIRVSTLERQATSRRGDEFAQTKLSLDGEKKEGASSGSGRDDAEAAGAVVVEDGVEADAGANVEAAVVLGSHESNSDSDSDSESESESESDSETQSESESDSSESSDESEENGPILNPVPGGNAGGLPNAAFEGNMSPQEIEELLIAEAIRLSLQQES